MISLRWCVSNRVFEGIRHLACGERLHWSVYTELVWCTCHTWQLSTLRRMAETDLADRFEVIPIATDLAPEKLVWKVDGKKQHTALVPSWSIEGTKF